jgi:hypothetical protein
MTKTLEIQHTADSTWAVRLYESEDRSTKLAGEIEADDFKVVWLISEAWCRDKWSAADAVGYVEKYCIKTRVVKRRVVL